MLVNTSQPSFQEAFGDSEEEFVSTAFLLPS